MSGRRFATYACLGIAGWLGLGFIGAGFKNASDLHDHCGQTFSRAFREIDHGTTAMAPLSGGFGLLMALSYSGFGENGWTFERDCPAQTTP